MTSPRHSATQDVPADAEAQAVSVQFHRLAERLEAAGNYLEALRYHLRASGHAQAIEFADKAAEAAKLAMEEYHGLRDRIIPR